MDFAETESRVTDATHICVSFFFIYPIYKALFFGTQYALLLVLVSYEPGISYVCVAEKDGFHTFQLFTGFLLELLDLPIKPPLLRLVFSRADTASLLHALVAKLCGQ